MSCTTYQGEYTTPSADSTPIELICRGSNPNFQGTNWINFWSGTNGTVCQSEFSSILYGGLNPQGIRTYDPFNLSRVRANMNNVFRTYTANFNITTVGQPGFNAFQNTLFSTCEAIPGLCDNFLDFYCTGCSRETIANSNLLTRICGCKAPALPAEYNITDPSCDPLCNKANAIHNLNIGTGAGEICTADVCVIDDINITATNSNIGGGIIFSQLCNSCKEQS